MSLTIEMTNITEIQDSIIEEFSFFDDWTEKYKHIIEIGKELAVLPDEHKINENKVKGCQSTVWLHTYLDGERLFFEADSDAAIVKGLVSLLVRIYSGQHPDEIINSNLYFIDKIEMRQHLSPNRSNGLAAMVKQMKFYALAYKAKL